MERFPIFPIFYLAKTNMLLQETFYQIQCKVRTLYNNWWNKFKENWNLGWPKKSLLQI